MIVLTNRLTLLTLAACLVLTATGCGMLADNPKATPADPQLVSLAEADPDTFTIGFDETLEIEETGLRLHFEDVADSRCAADVVCVWAGEAKLTFRATGPQGDERVELVLPGLVPAPYDQNEAVVVLGHQVRLLRVDPYPYSSTPQRKASYRALIEIAPEADIR